MTPLNNHNNKIICSGLSLRGHFPCAGASRQCEQLPYAHALLCTRHVTSVCVGHNVTCVKQSLALIGRKYVIEIPEWSFTPCNIGDGLPARSEPWSIPDPALVIFQQRCHKIKLSGLRMPCLKTTSFSYIFFKFTLHHSCSICIFSEGWSVQGGKGVSRVCIQEYAEYAGWKMEVGSVVRVKSGRVVKSMWTSCCPIRNIAICSHTPGKQSKSFRLLFSVRNAWTLRSFSRNHPKSFRLPIRKTADSEN